MNYDQKIADLERRFRKLEQANQARDAALSSHARILDQLQARFAILGQKVDELSKILAEQTLANSHVNAALMEINFTSSAHGMLIQQLQDLTRTSLETARGVAHSLGQLREGQEIDDKLSEPTADCGPSEEVITVVS